MGARQSVYLFHRWVSVVVCLQLVAWSAGGLFFSLFSIETIRGSADARQSEVEALDWDEAVVTPRRAAAALAGAGQTFAPIRAVCLERAGTGSMVYRLLGAERRVLGLVDAVGGSLLPQLDAAAAVRVAMEDFAPSADVASIELISEDPPLEVRGRDLPLWKVVLDHPRRPHIYVDAISGEVVARRNRLWRIFDFFWMLHIMDYSQRENFHHPLLTAMSALALLSSLSGLALWGWRLGAWRRRRSRGGTS